MINIFGGNRRGGARAYHLAHASLPLCEEEQALRLLAADELIEAGVTPETLMKAQGFDPTPLALLRANFNQAQPRWAAGRAVGAMATGGRATSARPMPHPAAGHDDCSQVRYRL
jgi:hypothetical protein